MRGSRLGPCPRAGWSYQRRTGTRLHGSRRRSASGYWQPPENRGQRAGEAVSQLGAARPQHCRPTSGLVSWCRELMELSAGRRQLRVAALISLALAIVLGTGVVYLRPSFRAPAAAVTPAPARPSVGSAFFSDGDHGVVTASTIGSPLATLFLTRDGGRTWSRAFGGPPSVILSNPWFGSRFLVVASTRPGASVRVSGDAGQTWRTLPLPPNIPQANVVYGAIGGPVLLSATDGWWMTRPAPGDPYTVQLWRTMDGSTWTRLPAAGIPSDGYEGQLWFADDRHGLLLVSDPPTRISVLTTDDGGATWGERARFGPPFLGAYTVGAAVVAYRHRLVLCVETLPNPPSSGPLADPFLLSPSLYTATSTDGGATWGPLVAGPGFSSATIPVFDDQGRMLLLSDRRLWISESYGAAWQARLVALPAGVRVLTLNSAVKGALFAIGVASKPTPSPRGAAFPPTVLLKSRDAGVHWEQLALPALAS